MTDGTLCDHRVPVVLSAHAEDLIAHDATAILRYLDGRTDTAPSDVAYTLLRTRRLRRHRAVIRAGVSTNSPRDSGRSPTETTIRW